jgi:hypothetical protein
LTSWLWLRARPTLHSLLALARHELRMTLRGRAGWGAGIAACALAFADAAIRPHFPIIGGLRASTFGGPLMLTPLAILFLAGAARRDEALSVDECVGSRPFPAHYLTLARFVGNFGLTLLFFALVIACSLLPSLVFAGRIASPLTPLHTFLRGIVPLLYITVLAYCAVTLVRNVLAAAVVAVYWLFVLLWGDFLARIFNFTLTQNWPTYVAVALAVLLGTLAVQRRAARLPAGRWRALLPVTAVVLLLLGVGDAWHRVAHSHDKPLHQDSLALAMAGQYLETSPRLPGFWLPDQHGRGYRISETAGRVLVVGFWSPHIPGSATVLNVLHSISREFPPEQVACVAVCLSNDHAISPDVAPEGPYPFPMVTDTGTHFAGKVEDCSPIAEAYILHDVPHVFVSDRARRLVATLGAQSLANAEQVSAQVRRALTVQVPPLVE